MSTIYTDVPLWQSSTTPTTTTTRYRIVRAVNRRGRRLGKPDTDMPSPSVRSGEEEEEE